MHEYTAGTMPATPCPGPAPKPHARRGRPRSGGREAILASALDLLAERGASRLTTREVAARAGVSEGSVFYHFTDRIGLLTSVIEDSLTALMEVSPSAQAEVAETLDALSTGIERFLDQALIVLIAAQSDAELREGIAKFLLGKDFGPHRGIDGIARYLRGRQQSGLVRADVDPEPIAMMLLGSLFLRVCMRQMMSPEYAEQLPSRSQLLASLITMLRPPPG